ncbi:MAG TPA: membrane protein insertase YidC [Spongiibacteraceae bacterium]|nr:membrane protein insertase YidC [Spongiibacteraceae bacterium]
MDLQRYLLIGAIALLSFMLLTEWVQFQDQHKDSATASRYQTQRDRPADAEAMPNVEIPPAAPANEDLPTLPAAEAPRPEAVAVQRLVKVTTDTLEIGIDTRGGDVVFAALPQHLAKLNNSDVPFVLLENGDARTYIAQSGLLGERGPDTKQQRAAYTSAKSDYRLADGTDQLQVDLLFEQDGLRITKRFEFTRGDYLINVRYIVENTSDEPYAATPFAQLKRDSSKDPGVQSSGMGMGMSSYLGAATTSADKPFQKISFSDIAEKKYQKTQQGGWVAMLQHYFLSAWIPAPDAEYNYRTAHMRDGTNIIGFTAGRLVVAPKSQGEFAVKLYVGPKDQERLEQISPGLELSVDYGFLWWIAQPLFALLTWFHGVVGNWGWAIVLVTLMVKLLFFQLNATAYKSMANMRRVQPKLMEMRERYADDKQKQSQEMMNLYKKEKINPLGGCLPILVQMPVFIALYWVLLESIELRHAPWILWIRDLSSMDPYFILPLLMGASMFIQQKLNPPPPDPMQAKIMQWLPVIFTFFFLWFPAGLVLYWVVNNILSIAQQYIITRRIEGAAAKAATKA